MARHMTLLLDWVWPHLDGQDVGPEVLAETRVVQHQHCADEQQHVILKTRVI